MRLGSFLAGLGELDLESGQLVKKVASKEAYSTSLDCFRGNFRYLLSNKLGKQQG